MNVCYKELLNIYEQEVKNKKSSSKKINSFELNKVQYLMDIKRIIENNLYEGSKYNIFLVYQPKIRIGMSQNMYYKVIDKYITNNILITKFEDKISSHSYALKSKMGPSKAVKSLLKDINDLKHNGALYFLKLDIKNYFYSIDHEILKSIIKPSLDQEEFELISKAIDSTNKEYINLKISSLERKINQQLLRYEKGKGLAIGTHLNQFLALIYLNEIYEYISQVLKIKFVCYMDDFILIHNDKEYLKKSLHLIEEKLNNGYKLKINTKKTMITTAKQGTTFLGYKIMVINNKTILKLSIASKIKLRNSIKKTTKLYKKDIISFAQYYSRIESYKNMYNLISRYKINEILKRYIGYATTSANRLE